MLARSAIYAVSTFLVLLGAQAVFPHSAKAQQCCSCGSSCPQYYPGDGMKCKCCYCGVSATIQDFAVSSPGHGTFKTEKLSGLKFYIPDSGMSEKLLKEWKKNPSKPFKLTVVPYISGPNASHEFKCIGYDESNIKDRTKEFEKSHQLRKQLEAEPTHEPEHPYDK